MAITGIFDFDINIHGAWVVVRPEPHLPGCKSDGEIDAQIARLKDDLDAVAKRMKSAIKQQSGEPILPGES